MIGDKIKILKKIGKGTFASVFMGKNIYTNELYAVKKVNKEFLENSGMISYFNNEIYILKHINPHQNIIKFHTIFETTNSYYSVFDYCNGNSLKNALNLYVEKNKIPFPEDVVKYIIRQIIDGLVCLNSQKIIHRDIKAENILLNYNNQNDLMEQNVINSTVKIIDFGFARYLDNNELAASIIGTPLFMEPNILKYMAGGSGDDNENYNNKENYMKSMETIQGFYDYRVDIWSLGVLTYQLLFNKFPFEGKTYAELYNNIKNNNFSLPDNKQIQISYECIRFLQKILNVDAANRPNAEQLKRDEWITSNNSSGIKYKICDKSKLKKGKINFIDYWVKVENIIYSNILDIKDDKKEFKKSESCKNMINRKDSIKNFLSKIKNRKNLTGNKDKNNYIINKTNIKINNDLINRIKVSKNDNSLFNIKLNNENKNNYNTNYASNNNNNKSNISISNYCTNPNNKKNNTSRNKGKIALFLNNANNNIKNENCNKEYAILNEDEESVTPRKYENHMKIMLNNKKININK